MYLDISDDPLIGLDVKARHSFGMGLHRETLAFRGVDELSAASGKARALQNRGPSKGVPGIQAVTRGRGGGGGFMRP